MKDASLPHLARCAAAALMLAAVTAVGQDPSDTGTIPVQSASYVGDIPIEQATGDSVTVHGRSYGRPDLFYNFYTQGYANQANAQMYLSPHPIPPNVGHTFFTYQPFYPHHMLYAHKDRFHRTYDHGRGMNRTRVSYRPAVRQVVCDLYWNMFRLPR